MQQTYTIPTAIAKCFKVDKFDEFSILSDAILDGLETGRTIYQLVCNVAARFRRLNQYFEVVKFRRVVSHIVHVTQADVSNPRWPSQTGKTHISACIHYTLVYNIVVSII